MKVALRSEIEARIAETQVRSQRRGYMYGGLKA